VERDEDIADTGETIDPRPGGEKTGERRKKRRREERRGRRGDWGK
jgi:hypothetical protein